MKVARIQLTHPSLVVDFHRPLECPLFRAGRSPLWLGPRSRPWVQTLTGWMPSRWPFVGGLRGSLVQAVNTAVGRCTTAPGDLHMEAVQRAADVMGPLVQQREVRGSLSVLVWALVRGHGLTVEVLDNFRNGSSVKTKRSPRCGVGIHQTLARYEKEHPPLTVPTVNNRVHVLSKTTGGRCHTNHARLRGTTSRSGAVRQGLSFRCGRVQDRSPGGTRTGGALASRRRRSESRGLHQRQRSRRVCDISHRHWEPQGRRKQQAL